jgi:flagellar biosynthesis GTPase FlhF
MSIETFSAISEIAEHYSENIAEADLLLREICQSGRRPTFAELTFFQREIGWDSIAVQSQLRRMNNVLRLQAIAGTSDDREASVKESETAAAVAETELPKLAAKRQKIEVEENRIKRERDLSAKRCEEQSGAAEQLRTLAPENIAGSVRSAVQTIKSSIGREISDAEVRANELRCCLTPSLYKTEAAYLEVLQRSFGDAVTMVTINRVIRRKLSAAWPGIRAEIETELTELHPKLVELRAQYAEQISAAEQPLSYYAS